MNAITLSHEAMKQALEALKAFQYRSEGCVQPDFVDDAITALRQALEANIGITISETCKACGEGQADLVVLRICDKCGSEYFSQAEFDLAMRLQAERQDEPAAWCRLAYNTDGSVYVDSLTFTKDRYCNVPLYTAPQPAQQPLTEEQIDALAIDGDGLPNSHLEFARAIERSHGIGETK
jgi:hypothetical protein